MTRQEVINQCTIHLKAASDCKDNSQYKYCNQHLTTIMDLLLEELIGGPPNPPTPHPAKFNPERVLVDVANAVRHRPISVTERWQIIYYHTRICCVPHTCTVPQQIILHTFTEQMAREGFSATYWHQVKMNIIALYKELES